MIITTTVPPKERNVKEGIGKWNRRLTGSESAGSVLSVDLVAMDRDIGSFHLKHNRLAFLVAFSVKIWPYRRNRWLSLIGDFIVTSSSGHFNLSNCYVTKTVR